MAGSSLLALIDDIATLLDDISLMTKVAAKKTTGVLGDDLALNAEQVSGIRAERELPVVWAVAKGSLLNKSILVPAALAISAVIPWAVTPLLMLGGAFLCYEGFEKVLHSLFHAHDETDAQKQEKVQRLNRSKADLMAFEKQRIKGAIRTDFILSAEIIVITLGIVKDMPFVSRLVVLALIAFVMTVGVYGLVAGIVKLDDGGMLLVQKSRENGNRFYRWFGIRILQAAPWLMKFLSIAGTIAMFTVGGSILLHGLPMGHHWSDSVKAFAQSVPAMGEVLAFLAPALLDAAVGLAVGAVLVPVVSLVGKLRR